MIRKVGVIYQDRISLGFLQGICDRLRCDADLIEAPAAIGIQQRLAHKNANSAWQYFRRKGVDVVVRFTDADDDKWQDVRRAERNVFPSEAQPVLVCGVADPNPEEWLALNRGYLAKSLGITPDELLFGTNRTGLVKHRLSKLVNATEGASEVVARLVRDCEHRVFATWLHKSGSLRRFYQDCRAIARQFGCETPNELGAKA